MTQRQVPLVIAPTIKTSALLDGAVGQWYEQDIFIGPFAGTQSPLITVRGLPPGLTFHPVLWRITGAPTASGTYPVTIDVTDNDVTTTVTLPLVVGPDKTPTPAPTNPVIDAKLPDGTLGAYYRVVLFRLDGKFEQTRSVTGLPPGLRLDMLSGDKEIVGTPTTAGTYLVDITVDLVDGPHVLTTQLIVHPAAQPTAPPAR